jgi:hypothetical protein
MSVNLQTILDKIVGDNIFVSQIEGSIKNIMSNAESLKGKEYIDYLI